MDGSILWSCHPFEVYKLAGRAEDTDHFGNKRNATNPFPGPFAQLEGERQLLKVWSLPQTARRTGYPHRRGDKLPETRCNANRTSLTVQRGDQTDQWQFQPDDDGRVWTGDLILVSQEASDRKV